VERLLRHGQKRDGNERALHGSLRATILTGN
jgi:hypothetical protein